MADWFGSARSNYFKVKDEAAFKQWAEQIGLEAWEDNRDRVKYFAMCPDESEFGGWPTWLYDDDGNDTEIDLEGDLAKHLQDDSVAVLMECGADKLRYLTGITVAVNSKGETVHVPLNDIYNQTKGLGKEITDALY